MANVMCPLGGFSNNVGIIVCQPTDGVNELGYFILIPEG